MDRESRLKYLRDQASLSGEEMQELIDLADAGEIVEMPHLGLLGVDDLQRAVANLQEVNSRVETAVRAGCYLEAISLRIQFIEMALRSYWLVRNGQGKALDPDDRRTFGRFVEECANLGFDADLADELRAFNKARVNAVHKFLLGVAGYDAFQVVRNDSATLSKRVLQFTGKAIGVPLKAQ